MAQKQVKNSGLLIFADLPFADNEPEEWKDTEPFMPMEPFLHCEKFLMQLINYQVTIMHKRINAGRFLEDLVPYDEYKNYRPFYLRDTFPWSSEYANRRNYIRELLHICFQPQIQCWRKMKKVINVSKAKKVAEGTYSEIYVADYNTETVIMKLFPIGDGKPIEGCRMSSFREAAAKLIIQKELSDLSQVQQGYSTVGFVQLKGAMVVKGSFPSSMIDAWKDYKRSTKSKKINPLLFPTNQKFLLLSLEECGTNLSECRISTIYQAYSIVYQLFIALAVAEFRLAFEHRDLNCKNILITNVGWHETIRCKFGDSDICINPHGLVVKILTSSFCRMTKDLSSIYFDWTPTEEFFMGEGDSDHFAFHAMSKINRNIWRGFWPVTNILWLSYIINFIHDRLQKWRIGTPADHAAFFQHFEQLHRYASAWKWVHDHIDHHMKKEIIERE